jgi:hypothetical protein
MFKLQITLNRHNARQRLNYYFLPDPSHFSLPSTFKTIPTLVWQRGEGLDGVVERLSINHLVGARAGEDRPCAGWESGREKDFSRLLDVILISADEFSAAFMRAGSID